MSIASAISSASSGLSVSSRLAEVIASNIANALNENYGKQSAELVSRGNGTSGAGVSIVGVTRDVDQALLQGLRLAVSTENYHGSLGKFYKDIETSIAGITNDAALASAVSAFEKSLISAAASPENEGRLQAVLNESGALITRIGAISENIQVARQNAENTIAKDVARVNAVLQHVAQLNSDITQAAAAGSETATLQDTRQKLINELGAILPVKERPATLPGQISLQTASGIVLLDGSQPVTLQFTKTEPITPDMSLAAGDLSGISVNGISISATPDGGKLGMGRLSAAFEIRDIAATNAQTKIDALARNLIERFSSPQVDPTLVGGAPGLFTDNNGPFIAANEAGLAGRLKINAAADPRQGGALWRIREGMGAVAPVAPGDSTVLNAMSAAISAAQVPNSGRFNTSGSFAELSTSFLSSVAQNRLKEDSQASFASAQTKSLRTEILNHGVDTDEEMQDLLSIEQAYAANAKVIDVLNQMLQTILGI